MVQLLDLPRECLFEVFRGTSHHDLARLRQTCRTLNQAISSDHLLYRVMYLDQWDEPRSESKLKAEQWRAVGERFARMIQVLELNVSENITDWVAKPSLVPIAETILEFIGAANSKGGPRSKNADVLARLFKDEANQDTFLGHSSTFMRCREPQTPNNRTLRSSQLASNELSAKIHCLYGTPLYVDWRQEEDVYPYACSRTYDLRNYRTENHWGPFKDDGSLDVDWEKVESAMIILGANVKRYRDSISKMLPELWRSPFDGAWSNSYRVLPAHMHEIPLIRPLPSSAQLTEPPVGGDPYGVTGTWMRIVCFLDYQDLVNFNTAGEQPAGNEPRPPINIREATRIITMQIVATKLEPPGEDVGQDYPIVHFRGTSRATHHSWDSHANSHVRGTVSQTKEGEIRWTSYSVYYGEERWKSEGVQVGGIRSGRGVYGHWFDRNYDPEGPAGPTAFWKISNDYDVDDAHGLKRRRSAEGFSSDDTDLDTHTPDGD